MNIKVNQEEKLFWQLESEYLHRKDDLEYLCEQADNLKKALDTGVNSVRLQYEDHQDFVGYKNPDGTYDLSLPYEADRISSIGVNFLELDEDGDGYTIAIFTPEVDNE